MNHSPRLFVSMAILMAFTGALGSDVVLAQKNRKPVFGSTYTNLGTGWRVDPRFATTQKEDEAAGRDTPQVHAGIGGYSFRESYSAFARHRSLVSASASDFSLDLVTTKPGLQMCRDTVEWRTAGGKPFAVITRVEVYDGEAAVSFNAQFTPEHRTGTYLIVRGLRGYGHIKADVNVATTANANARARTIADAGYKNRK